VLSINASEPWTRQRFSLLHELKHVLDHPYVDEVYAGEEQAEHLADYFAACVLMPRRYVKRVWGEGMQTLAALSQHFGVSERAVSLRLQHLGLRSPVPRHAPSPHSERDAGRRRRYQRARTPALGMVA
jgi:Zn-dependent peptidase ImmA (M78 family)